MKRSILFLLVVLLVLVTGCDVKKPVFPEWDLSLRVPLMNRSFFVSDLVDSVNIVLGDDDILVLRGTGFAYTQEDTKVRFTPQVDASNVPLLSGVNTPLSFPIADAQDRVELWYGVISTGAVKVRFNNMSPQTQQVKLTFNDIHLPNGSVYEIEYNSSSSGWESHSLDGCSIGHADLSAVFDQLHLNVTVSSSLPNGTPVGSVDLQLNERINFSEMHGRLSDFDIPAMENAGSIDIAYPENLENTVRLMEAKLKLLIENEVGFICEIQGAIKAERTDTGQQVIVPLLKDDGSAMIIQAADANGPGTAEFIMENGIGQMMQIMPNKISLINMKYVLRQDLMSGIGSIRSTERVLCNYQVDVPFTMILFDSFLKLKKPIELNIDENNQRLFRDNIGAADLQFMVLNNLPLGCEMQMIFSTQSEVDHEDPSTYLMKKVVTLHSHQWVEANPNAPNINSEGEQFINFDLNEEEMDIFANPTLYLNLVFTMEDTNNQPVSIKGTPADYIRVRSMIKANITVTEDI